MRTLGPLTTRPLSVECHVVGVAPLMKYVKLGENGNANTGTAGVSPALREMPLCQSCQISPKVSEPVA